MNCGTGICVPSDTAYCKCPSQKTGESCQFDLPSPGQDLVRTAISCPADIVVDAIDSLAVTVTWDEPTFPGLNVHRNYVPGNVKCFCDSHSHTLIT